MNKIRIPFSFDEKGNKALELLNQGAQLLLFARDASDLKQQNHLLHEAAIIHLTACGLIKEAAFGLKKPGQPVIFLEGQ